MNNGLLVSKMNMRLLFEMEGELLFITVDCDKVSIFLKNLKNIKIKVKPSI